MKRIITFLFVLLFSAQGFSQSYSIAKDTTKVFDDISDIGSGAPFPAIVNLTVHASSPEVTKWERTVPVLPAGWETSFCDLEVCSGANVSTSIFTVYHDTTGQVILDFVPVSAGYAVASVHFYDTSNVSDGVTATFTATVTDVSGVRKISRLKDIYLSPVPAKENLTVVYDAALNPSKVEIYNVLGQMIKTLKVINDGTSKVEINLSGFEKGLYFLRLFTADNKVLTRQFSKD